MTGMTSPHFLRLAKLASVVVALLALSGCNDCTPDKPCCNAGEICGCEDGTNSCLLECGSGCDLECATGNGCEQVCGDDCEIECKDMPTCDGSCGANCDYHCTSVTKCTAEVGDGSTVTCENSGGCDIICDGSCAIIAQSVGGGTYQCRVGGGELIAATQDDPTHYHCD